MFYRTRFGRVARRRRAPRAADTLGVNVTLVRYLCVILSGILAGFGGASITLATVSAFRPTIVVGQGFIAIAAVIFGNFKPQGAMLGCILFGFCNGLRVVLGSDAKISFTLFEKAVNIPIPVNIISMIPYVVTIITLVLFVGRARGRRRTESRISNRNNTYLLHATPKSLIMLVDTGSAPHSRAQTGIYIRTEGLINDGIPQFGEKIAHASG